MEKITDIDGLCWIVTFLSLLGAFYVAKANILGQKIWIFTNSFLCFKNYNDENLAGAFLFMCFMGLSIYAVLRERAIASYRSFS